MEGRVVSNIRLLRHLPKLEPTRTWIITAIGLAVAALGLGIAAFSMALVALLDAVHHHV